MALPFFAFTRPLLIRKHLSKRATSIIPFKEIKRAVVLVSPKEKTWKETAEEAEKFFKSHNIEVLIVVPSGKYRDTAGRIKRSVRYPGPEWAEEDLLISLYPKHAPEADYEARCSISRHKIGRYDDSHGSFDTIIINPEGQSPSQAEVFRTIADIIVKYV